MKIEKLNWDSNFFNLRIGKIECKEVTFSKAEIEDIEKYDLIYVISENKIDNPHLSKPFTKVEFKFELKNCPIYELNLKDDISAVSDEISNNDVNKLNKLAFAAGEYSRFRRDEKFNKNEFTLLYLEWIRNSINQKIADKVLIHRDEHEVITGFITLKFHELNTNIGLLAVDKEVRQQGIGRKLIERAKYYAQNYGSENLVVSTQLDNISACSFYKKNNFNLINQYFIYHLWII